MKAVIIDDNLIFAKQFCKMAVQLAKEQNFFLEMEAFSEENKWNILNFLTVYDIYFLDIEMPGQTGIELAKEWRQKHFDKELIFVSAYEHYMRKVFPVKPLAFIRKSHLEEDMREAIAILQEQQKFRTAVIPLGKEGISIYPHQILYGQSMEHYVKLVTYGREQELPLFRIRLDQIEEELADYYFLRIHERYLVNLFYVERIEQSKLWLRNGEKLPISRSQKKAVQQKLLEWFEAHHQEGNICRLPSC